MRIEDIKEVKEIDGVYIVNNNQYVPKDERNREYKEVKEWLKTNSLTPLLCEEEIEKTRVSDIKAKCKEMILIEYSESDQLNILATQDSELIAPMREYIKDMIAISDRAIENKTPLEDINWSI
jgi:hypothetical protein